MNKQVNIEIVIVCFLSFEKMKIQYFLRNLADGMVKKKQKTIIPFVHCHNFDKRRSI